MACERLGAPRELEREYAKVSGERVWMDRVVWMLAGVLLLTAIGWLSSTASYLAVRGLVGRLSPHWVGFAANLVGVVNTILVILAFWWTVTSLYQSRGVARFVSACLRRPFLPFLALVVFNYSGPVLWRAFRDWLGPFHEKEMAVVGPVLNLWSGWASQAETALWVAALVWLARYRWVLTSAKASHMVWAERMVWMIAGVLISQQFVGLLTILPDMWIDALTQEWSTASPWLGFLTVCVQWATVAVGCGVAAWLVKAGARAVRPVVQFGLRHPVVGFAGILLCATGLAAVLALLMPQIPAHEWNATRGVILSWSSQGRAVLYNVMSVGLLLALARRRWEFRNRWI